MKKLVLITALALGGCATVPTASDITTRAQQIQQYTRLFCSFVPTIATVAAIINREATATASQMAVDICAAVTTAPLAEGPGRRGPPMYKGVRIKGSFVQ
jgi:hypothetical protein